MHPIKPTKGQDISSLILTASLVMIFWNWKSCFVSGCENERTEGAVIDIDNSQFVIIFLWFVKFVCFIDFWTWARERVENFASKNVQMKFHSLANSVCFCLIDFVFSSRWFLTKGHDTPANSFGKSNFVLPFYPKVERSPNKNSHFYRSSKSKLPSICMLRWKKRSAQKFQSLKL